MSQPEPPSGGQHIRAAIADARHAVAQAGVTPWKAIGHRPNALARRAYLRILRPYMQRRGEVDAALVRALDEGASELERLRSQAQAHESAIGDLARALDTARLHTAAAEERARRAEGALAVHRIESATVPRGPLGAPIWTVVSRTTIGHAWALARSVHRVHPGTDVFALVTEDCPQPAGLPFIPVPLEEVLGPETEAWRRRHAGVSLEYALTPACIRHALGRASGPVIFIKQESMVVGSLAPLLDGLNGAAIGLTPHFIAPPRGPDASERTRDVLLAGTFNGGVVVADGSAQSRRMAAWWEDRTRYECVKDVVRGRHFEQRWLDLLAATFDDVAVLRDPGLNIGHWNIADHEITGRPGGLQADGHGIAVLRFSGFDPHQPDVVTRYAPHRLRDGLGPLADHFTAFRHELITHGDS